MKVLLVNGSPRKEGCTFTALQEVAKTLNAEGIETEIFHIGNKPISGCIACRRCGDLGRCSISDNVNEFLDTAKDADGFIFGSPVYYAAAAGTLTCFMDRVFFADAMSGRQTFYFKPAAAVVSARRAGTTATFDQLNKYFSISQMPIVSSRSASNVSTRGPKNCTQRFRSPAAATVRRNWARSASVNGARVPRKIV